jgi:hypothetical protein
MMSISSQGGQQRRPSVVATGKKAPPAAKPADEAAESSTSTESASSASDAGAKAAGKTTGAGGAGGTKTASTAGSKAAGAKAAGAKAAGAKAAGAKAAGAKAAGAKAGGAKAAGGRPSGAGKAGAGARPGGKGGGPRRPITPVKVSQGRNWGPIALFTAVGLLAAGIIGWGAWAVYQNGRSWEDRAAAISGIVNFRESDPEALARNHKGGSLQYKVMPPVGGDHNNTWQRCMGDVYDAQIANENAVHSLEHGAVWITYRPDLPKDQVDALASKVRGQDFLLMSPFPGLDKPISLQAWGYQLKVDNASDGRIDEFISALRENATLEPGAVCSAGNYTTGTGTTPRDLTDQQNPGGMPGAGG